MSSRVQKGGTVFRPVAKVRARASATPGPAHGSSSSQSMPPPDTPAHTPSVTPTSKAGESNGGSRPPSVAPTRIQPGSARAAPVPIAPTRSAARMPTPPPTQGVSTARSGPGKHLVTPQPPNIDPALSNLDTPPSSTFPNPPSLQQSHPAPLPPTPTATQAPTLSQPLTQWQQWFPQQQASLPMDGGDLASLAMLGVPAPLGSDAPPASHQLPPQLMTATPAETSIGSAPHFPHLAFPAPEAGSSAGPSGSNAQESSSNDDEVLVRKNHAPRRRTKKPRPMVIDDENDAPLVEKKRARTKKEKGRQKASDSAAESGAESSSVQPPKRRRKATKLETPADGAAPAPAARRGRKRAPSPPPFDAHADPGEEPDPTRVAMADLVEDSGRGRVSARGAEIVSNHAAWKAASKVRRAALRAKVEAKKYGRAEDEDAALQEKDEVGVVKEGTAPPADEDVLPNPDMADEDAATPEPPLAEDDDAPADENAFDYAQRVNTSRFTVQVRIGPNGETVVDEQSLFVDRGEGEDDTAGYTHVEESDLTKFVNSASHSKKPTGSRWSAEETELFFDALRQFGENYELISLIMPGRDRKACRNKFKAEDRRNPNRITWSLNNRLDYDISTLSRMTGKDFSGPTPAIRMPTPILPPNPPAEKDGAPSGSSSKAATPKPKPRRKGKTQALAPDEEIVGAADTFMDTED